MTLPFRGRHHDAESGHDRARSLTSAGMVEPLRDDEAAWLAAHLDTCAECRGEHEAWEADRRVLRSLREQPVEPPRDLWARTSAEIDRESRGSRRRRAVATSGRAAGRDLWQGLPLGAAAGALVVLIVVGTSIFTTPQVPTDTPNATNDVALTIGPQPTNLSLAAAADVGWMRPAANGAWELVVSDVDEVCPRSKGGCALFGVDTAARPVDIGDDATGLLMSPNARQLVVASRTSSTEAAKVYVIPVPSEDTVATPEPPVTEPSAPATESPSGPAVTEAPPTSEATPVVGPSDTPGSTPAGAIELASGVTMVGEAAYNDDGTWLAFSARPSDDSTGPDLYLWKVGDDAATAVTTDHQTYFSTWLEGRVVASSVLASEGPSAAAHPVSFLLDPASGERTDVTQPDVWLPVVDAAGRFTTYWSGTLVPTADGLGWKLDAGELVLDEWLGQGQSPASSDATGASAAPGVGPAGRQVALPVGDVATFQAKFDPDGLRVAIWGADEADALVGRLHLVVIDGDTGTVDPSVSPLPGAPALRRFSIDQGRLAWVSPRGQDGQESAVQVLGWAGREFGEVQTVPEKDLFIVR